MTPADLEAGATVVLVWLLTYAIHSTILLAVAACAAWRFADDHAWLDVIWKTAVIAPMVTASLNIGALPLPLPGRSTASAIATAQEPLARPTSATPDAERVPSARAADDAAKPEGAISVTTGRIPIWLAMVRKWPLLATTAWLSVASFLLLSYGIRLRRAYRALRSGAPVTAELLATTNELRTHARPGPAIRLTTSSACPVPLALGVRHIVVPERFLRELDAEQQRAALAHEIAHLARRDPAWRIALEILERVLFFQPLNRLARVRVCDAAEFLCDEWAVRQTASPLALARCLAVVATWWSPTAELPAGVSAMARSDSAMVRRVTRILSETPRVATAPNAAWLLLPVTVVALAAPHVTAAQLPASVVAAAVGAIVATPFKEPAAEQHETRKWTPAEIASARAQVRDYQTPRIAGALEQRWRRALADAAAARLADFWIVYTFTTPTHANDMVLSDSLDGSFVSSNGQLVTQGPPLTTLLNRTTVPLEGGSLAVTLHYSAARAEAIDRAGYRSVQLGFDFGRAPVFWLGDAPEAESFTRVQSLFDQARTEKVQVLLIELASMHSDTDAVLPFLTRLVDRSQPSRIRREAAEGFDHHHDPRSVEILLRVARTDPDSSVRAEAAEAIGEVQTPQAIPALTDLVRESDDPDVRREAAEAFGHQPPASAIPAIESVIASSSDEDVLGEAIEALGELGVPAALTLLVQTVNTHANHRAQQEAVETIGELEAPGAVDALTRIVQEHPDVTIQREAVETLGDRDDAVSVAALERIAREHDREEVQIEAIDTIADGEEGSLHPLLLELAVTGRTARIRREALDAIGESVRDISDPQLLDRAQATIERAVFNDPEIAVRVDALEALDALPGDRGLRALRDVIARHPDARVRREAEELARERQE
jgi:HEAT repeat protein/beta-lactamase regulating signal transducer with metallopeptidase domain